MNVTVVQFFPLEVEGLVLPPSFGAVALEPAGVLRGVVSDDACASKPCLHNATCELTWNDYTYVPGRPETPLGAARTHFGPLAVARVRAATRASSAQRWSSASCRAARSTRTAATSTEGN